MTRLYLVRHAQTAWNRENRLQGHSDLPLDDQGERQAARVGRWFAALHLQGIVTSHLRRSQQTAAAIASGNGHHVVPVIDRRLAEMHLGAWEGLTPDEVDRRFAGAYAQWRERPTSVCIPDAEPLERFRVRVREALADVVARHAARTCAVVTHGGVIALVLADALGAEYDEVLRRVRLENAGVTAMEFEGDGRAPHVVWVNRTDYLEDLGG